MVIKKGRVESPPLSRCKRISGGLEIGTGGGWAYGDFYRFLMVFI